MPCGTRPKDVIPIPISTSPYVLRDVSFTMKLASDTTGTAVEYKCQLSAVTLTPSDTGGAGGATLETFCDTYSSEGTSGSTWTVDLSGFSSFADAEDFTRFCFVNEGETADFTFVPGPSGVISATNPGFKGQLTVKPTPIGGTAKQYHQFTVSLPCTSKPQMVTTAVFEN